MTELQWAIIKFIHRTGFFVFLFLFSVLLIVKFVFGWSDAFIYGVCASIIGAIFALGYVAWRRGSVERRREANLH